MHIWKYIGLISTFFLVGSIFVINAPRLQGKKTQNVIIVMLLASLLLCVAIIWPQKADAMLYAEAETIFSVKNQRGQSVTLLQEVESGQYYIVGPNIDNLIVPTYRYYLTDKEANEYIARYKSLVEAQNALVNDMNTIIPSSGG